ncbi:MAG TPA: hypothetical protein VMB21_06345, partial [Candidatus Limnocylindria bacterium]|nr:hypothetical protein [Candidatus Limnocylindria bacterium]
EVGPSAVTVLVQKYVYVSVGQCGITPDRHGGAEFPAGGVIQADGVVGLAEMESLLAFAGTNLCSPAGSALTGPAGR